MSVVRVDFRKDRPWAFRPEVVRQCGVDVTQEFTPEKWHWNWKRFRFQKRFTIFTYYDGEGIGYEDVWV